MGSTAKNLVVRCRSKIKIHSDSCRSTVLIAFWMKPMNKSSNTKFVLACFDEARKCTDSEGVGS